MRLENRFAASDSHSGHNFLPFLVNGGPRRHNISFLYDETLPTLRHITYLLKKIRVRNDGAQGNRVHSVIV